MIKTAIFLFFLLGTSFAVSADYSASNYDPSYVPFNFNSAAEKDDYIECQNSLEEFDTAYWTLENEMAKSIQNSGNWTRGSFNLGAVSDKQVYVFDVRVNTFSDIKRNGELGFSQCIQEYPDYISDKEAEQADKLAQLEKEEDAEERARIISIALGGCDFEVIETFSVDEKMQTYDERMACEAKANEPEPTPTPVGMEPVVFPEPVITEPVVTQYVPLPAPTQVTEEVVEDPESEQIEEQTSTTTEEDNSGEKIEVTQEELDRMVENRMNEKLNEPEPEPVPEPSFFKKVVNFLFGWMF